MKTGHCAFLLCLFFLGSSVSAQYRYVGEFPYPGFVLNNSAGVHGVVVDPEGKVWIQPHQETRWIWDEAQSTYIQAYTLHVFYPDGTPTGFSPLTSVTVDSANHFFTGRGRGLGSDRSGNILVSFFDDLFRINYKTGEGMDWIVPAPNMSLTAATADTAGHIFIGLVAQEAGPIWILDSGTFQVTGTVVDVNQGYSRAMSVSADGKDLYYAGYSHSQVYVYHSDSGGGGPFVPADTILHGFVAESFTRHPETGNIWLSSGSGMDLPNRHPTVPSSYTSHTWYEYDPLVNALTDSIAWTDVMDPYWQRPRGISFSPTGDTAYVAMFGNSYLPMVQMFVSDNLPASVDGQYEPDTSTVALFHLDEEGDTLSDVSAYMQSASVTGTTPRSGKYGRSRSFDGIDDRISVTSSPALNPTQGITLEAWVQPSGLSSYNMIIRKEGVPGEGGYLLGFASNGAIIQFGINSAFEFLTNTVVPYDTARLRDGRWHHIAGTYDGKTARVYLDRVLIDEDVFGVAMGSNSTQDLSIGSGGSGGQYFQGKIDEVRISDRARLPQELGVLMPPTGISLISFGNMVRLAWDDAAPTYRIYVSNDSSSLHLNAETQDPFYTMYGYWYDATVYFQISSVSEDGIESSRSPVYGVGPDPSEFVYNLIEDIPSARVFASGDSGWTIEDAQYGWNGNGWLEPGGSGSFVSSYGSSGGTYVSCIDAFPSDAGIGPAATVAEYSLDRPKNISVRFGIKDGSPFPRGAVRFVIQVSDSARIETLLDSSVTSAGWHTLQRSLTGWDSSRVRLRLITDPHGEGTNDWAAWGEPLVSSYGPFPLPQENEPNNTAGLANSLAIGDSLEARINPEGDVDYFSFDASEGDTLLIRSYRPEYMFEYYIRIFDSTGVLLADSKLQWTNSMLSIPVAIPSAGRYYIQCSSGTDSLTLPDFVARSLGKRSAGAAQTISPRSVYSASDTGLYRIVLERFHPGGPGLRYITSVVPYHDMAYVSILLNPNGSATTVAIRYGLQYYGLNDMQIVGTVDGLEEKRVEYALTGLLPDTIYYAQVQAWNRFDTVWSGMYGFSTPKSPQGWTRITTGSGGSLLDIGFVDSLSGLAIGDSTMLRTTNGGETWDRIPEAGSPRVIHGRLSTPNLQNIYMLSVRLREAPIGFLYEIGHSTDIGMTWSVSPAPSMYASDLDFATSTTGCLIGYADVLRTTDGGQTWSEAVVPEGSGFLDIEFADSITGFIVGYSGLLLRTTNAGATWSALNSGTSSSLRLISAATSRIVYIAGSAGNILKTMDGGLTWNRIWPTEGPSQYGPSISSMAVADANHIMFCMPDSGMTMRSTDGGATWMREYMGVAYYDMVLAYPAPDLAFAAGAHGTLLRSNPLSDVTGPAAGSVVGYELYQNYPNPFNPETEIRFRLPVTSSVTIEIFDILGRIVERLMNKDLTAGDHNVRWRAHTLASGIYFYRFEAVSIEDPSQNLISVKRMVLVR